MPGVFASLSIHLKRYLFHQMGVPVLQKQIVDPSNPIPKYLQISRWLRQSVKGGTYKEGERLPSEIELSKMCKVNRNTLRQAVGQLVDEGILQREKGVGTYVSSTIPNTLRHKLKQINSFKDDLVELGISEKNRLISKHVEHASSYVADKLKLKKREKVVAIKRLRTGDGVPLIYEESFLPDSRFHDLLNTDLTQSMYRTLSQQFDTVLARCEQTIQAVNLNKTIARYLKVEENSAGLFMESLTFNDKNVPVEVLCAFYRGDKYIFEVELGRYHMAENGLTK